jgi:NAD(P)-dependent dehydrogenase (short-subunit alcohol dehydrogenase family)
MQGKVAIVTGASTGIGLSIARLWVARGGRVALVARTASKLEEAAREIGDAAAAFPLDVVDFAALDALHRRAHRRDCLAAPLRPSRDDGVPHARLREADPARAREAWSAEQAGDPRASTLGVVARVAAAHLFRVAS